MVNFEAIINTEFPYSAEVNLITKEGKFIKKVDSISFKTKIEMVLFVDDFNMKQLFKHWDNDILNKKYKS